MAAPLVQRTVSPMAPRMVARTVFEMAEKRAGQMAATTDTTASKTDGTMDAMTAEAKVVRKVPLKVGKKADVMAGMRVDHSVQKTAVKWVDLRAV